MVDLSAAGTFLTELIKLVALALLAVFAWRFAGQVGGQVYDSGILLLQALGLWQG